MKHTTPFFADFTRILPRRARRSAQDRLRAQAHALARATLCQLGTLCAPWIPERMLAPTEAEANSRRRSYPLSVTFWAFLSQVLSPETSCREMVRKVQVWHTARRQTRPSSGTAAYCRARARLPVEKLLDIHQQTAVALERNVSADQRGCGRNVKVVDGTGVSMPDTAANQRAFPQPSNQKRGCGFPVAKIVACFSLASGALMHWAEGTLRMHECKLFRRLFAFFQPGDVILADRAFCAYSDIAALQRMRVDTVVRQHQARRCDWRRGKRLGPKDRLVLWHKPQQRPAGCSRTAWRQAPQTLTLRVLHVQIDVPGFRTQSLVLVTTLNDPLRYRARDLAELYMRRWVVELFFRDIKTTMGMDVLRCLTPAMVRKEIAMHAIAYNLVRALMQRAAALYHVPLHRLSFKGSVDTLRQWADTLNAAYDKPREQARLFEHILQILAEDILPYRPNRSEAARAKTTPEKLSPDDKPTPLLPLRQGVLTWP